ncbi:MAG TPA: hypothetical protein VNK52_02735 [Hyphomicrobiaceae bacterium]|nr:hypothetical protein [Hyphomicrobiaceae bacterium]
MVVDLNYRTHVMGGWESTVAGRGAVVALAMMVLVVEALAQDKGIKGRFTSIDLSACERVEVTADGASWLCSGLPDYAVYFLERGSRQAMSFGADARRYRAAGQSLTADNSALDDHKRATVEWRAERRGGRDVPYAAIVRYRTAREGEKGEVLVITKIGDGEACHAAYIDALANAEAMALARSWADSEARKFDCRSKPRIVGNRGKSPM